MKRFGFVIRTGGDPEITGALIDGIEQGVREARGKHCREAVRRLDMKCRTREELLGMIAEAQAQYGNVRPLPGWAARALGLYGLVCYGVSLGWRRLMDNLGL